MSNKRTSLNENEIQLMIASTGKTREEILNDHKEFLVNELILC
jgi:hypothetical protein